MVPAYIVGMLTSAVEKSSKSSEFGIWMLTRGGLCIANFLKRRGFPINVPKTLLPMFIAAMTGIGYAYQNEDDCIRNNYVPALRKFYGKN